ncbi:hypothetical protein J6590_080750 [Homalodisca vitripennis]|nr:hypothetical protein J6590_080750 [Homalodisca vitripennis]
MTLRLPLGIVSINESLVCQPGEPVGTHSPGTIPDAVDIGSASVVIRMVSERSRRPGPSLVTLDFESGA